MKTGNRAHSILLFEEANCFPRGLQEALRNAEFATQTIQDLTEAGSLLEKLPHPIVVTDFGGSDDQAIEQVKTLIQQKPLHDHPLLLIGEEADGFEGVLDEYFKSSITVNTPCSTHEILGALEYLVRAYDRSIPSITLSEHDPSETATEVDLALDRYSAPNHLFEVLEELKISDQKIGAAELPQKLSLDELNTLGLLSFEQSLLATVNELFSQLGEWTKEHLCRTAYIADRFNDVLDVSETQKELCRAACLLMPCAFPHASRTPLQKNYLQADFSARPEMASKLKDSAMHAMGELSQPQVGQVLADAARLIGEEVNWQEEKITLISSSLVTADLMNRCCFPGGYWLPKGAHYLLNYAKSGNLADFADPKAIACMIKFLSEAIAHLPKTFLITRSDKNSPRLKAAAEENRNYRPQTNEKKVPLDSLEPGMRLSKPVHSYDGRKILSGAVLLDQDLIWRLWQLSSVRPMNTPMVVEKNRRRKERK